MCPGRLGILGSIPSTNRIWHYYSILEAKDWDETPARDINVSEPKYIPEKTGRMARQLFGVRYSMDQRVAAGLFNSVLSWWQIIDQSCTMEVVLRTLEGHGAPQYPR